MAYTIMKNGNLPNVPTQEIYCDTKEDMSTIPVEYTPIGSIVYIIEGPEIYMLNSKKEWVKQG